MRLLLISSILLFAQYPLVAQEDFEAVKISFFTEIISPSMDKCSQDENWVRVHGSYKIVIAEKAEIKELDELLLNSNKLKFDNEDPVNFNCRMVVDFIKNGKISSTISIGSYGLIRIDENYESICYINDNIQLFYESYVNFFRTELKK